jgi:hypothetical protein
MLSLILSQPEAVAASSELVGVRAIGQSMRTQSFDASSTPLIPE